MEVLHGDIRITLSDQDAIRGMQRTRAEIRRGLAQIRKEKAIITIEGDLKALDRDLKKARAKVTKLEGERARIGFDVENKELDAQLKEARRQVKMLDGKTIDMRLNLEGQREALAQMKAIDAAQNRSIALTEKRKEATAKAAALDEKAAVARERSERSIARLQSQALAMDHSRENEIVKLQKAYDKANVALQRYQKNNKPGFFTSPESRQRYALNEKDIIGRMELIRAKLKALNARPIEIPVDIEEKRALEKLAGIGNIGTRIGPFSGTLKEFTRAGLVLGPVITGLLGSVTALAGAIGAGLVGAAGIGAGALGAFGLSLGGVGVLTVSLFRDFKNLNTLQDAYHKAVLKYGKDNIKTVHALEQYKHALGAVTPTTLAAFDAVNKLQDRWRALRKQVTPEFYSSLGQAATTANADFGVFSRGTVEAFKIVSTGFNGWMRGLRSAEAQNIIFRLMDNGNKAIKPLMSSLGHLVAAGGRVTAAFSDHIPALVTEFDNWTGSIDHATQRTNGLNRGVGHLVGAFSSTLGVVTAFSRVIIEMSRAAMGPGGKFLDGIASGLNSIAANIRANPAPLRKFFGDSIQTTKDLYGTLQPLVKLFMEFSTILRPATSAVLSIITPIADLIQSMAGFAPIRTMLQGFATIWLFRYGASRLSMLTGVVKDLALAFKTAAIEAGGLRAVNMTAPISGGRAPVTSAVARGAETRIIDYAGVGGGVGVAREAGVAASEGGRVARTFGGLAKGLGALSTGLLGVSGPVAAMGLAAVGAGLAIKHMADSAARRAAEEDSVRRNLGRNVLPQAPNTRAPAQVPGLNPRAALAGQSLSQQQWNKQRDALVAVNKQYMEYIGLERQAAAATNDLVSAGSQLSNSRLMVEQAEKAYADAVKHSGKNSLDARLALQQLRDARTQESQSAKAWGQQASQAGTLVARSVAQAQRAFNAARGTAAQSEMAKKLAQAKDQAAAFEVNLSRAKKGVDVFSGDGQIKIGAFLRKFGQIPGVKRTLVQVDTQQAAVKLTQVIATMIAIGKRKTVTHILADAKNPEDALHRLNASLDKWEARHSTTHLQAEKRQAEQTLASANKALSYYGARKPQALLKARDDAKAKIDALERQLRVLDGKKATVTANVKFTLPSDFHTDASSGGGGYGGHGDGTGVPNLSKAVKNFAQAHPDALSQMFLGAGGLGNTAVSGSGLNAFNAIARRFGLTIGSGFRPGSITASGNLSYHAMGRARDFPGPPGEMMAFARFMAANFGSKLKELIYSPLGWGIKNGQRVPNSFWGPEIIREHYSHVHVAMAQGGKVQPGRYSSPHVLFAEEPGHPEYFISTNPRDKKRSQGLVRQAAADVGMVEPFARGGARGLGVVGAPGGGRLSREQQRILQTAIAMAKAYGAPKNAALALVAALWDESKAQNLTGGDASSTGALQLLSSTARGLHVNPRNVKAVIKLFLTHGFFGHGGAIALARKKGLSPAEIAHLVQGNRDGARSYSPFVGFARNVLSAVGGTGGSLGTLRTPAPRLHGATNTLANRISIAQSIVDRAASTTDNYSDDISAILGTDVKRMVRVQSGNRSSGTGSLRARHGEGGVLRKRMVHVPGLIDLTNKQTANAKRRLSVVRRMLRGRLTKDRRNQLLSEQMSLTQTISDNQGKVSDLRKTVADNQFEQRMARKGGPGSLNQINYRTARAETTISTADDLAAATAEQKYYKAREAWAKRRGDIQGATESRQNYNAATSKIKDITDSLRTDKFATDEAWITWSEGQASLTGGLQDDFTAATKALTYWQGRVKDAWGRGDIQGALSASGQVQQYTDKVKGLKDDMARLPLERDAALAALTDDTEDDKKATIALRDYWAGRLAAAKKAGDLQGQIDAAGNLKNFNDQIKAAEDSIATQMVLLAQARQDLFKSFGSNFLPTMFQGAAAGTVAAGGTTVNLTVNGATLGPDPHTWSKNVAWELQAAV